MKRTALLAAVAATLAFAAPFAATAQAQQPSSRLAAVLAQMDAASLRFHTAEADFTQQFYEAVVHETTTQTGSVYFERAGNGTRMGAVLHVTGGTAVERVLAYDNGTLQVFDPKVDQIQVLGGGPGASAQYEGFLTLGFGSSGKALAAAWQVSDLGPETLTVDGGRVSVEKLDLVGRDAGVRNNFSHVTLWVDPTRGVSLRQVFFTPSGDKRTTDYSHIRLNDKVNKSEFAIRKDKNTTVIRH